MHFHRPDPDYTHSKRSQANFSLAVKIAGSFVALLWFIHGLNSVFDHKLNVLALQPREFIGLLGIVFAPLLHANFSHLIANSLPLLVLLTGTLYLFPNSSLRVLPAVYIGTGVVVWLFARPSFHLGASGLVYGLAAYVFIAGIIRRDSRAIAAALLVYFLYGTLVWGVLPIKPGVSWETHLAAAIIGLLMAVILRGYDIPPRKRYAWEDEDDDELADNDHDSP